MKLVSCMFLTFMPCTPAPPGKSTIAASHPMESMEFLLKYLPVAVAEDNGTGNYGHGATQGRTQTIIDGSYSAPNCQLYSSEGSTDDSSGSKSMTSNGVGSACTYKSGSFGQGNEMWKVYANNEVQCCNACVSTSGCAAATFTTSSNDHSGGMGPQSWEGFGIHLPDVDAAKTTGGLSVDELIEKYESRFGDFTKFDAFMDYSVTFYTYDLQHYIDIFKADNIQHFLGQWKDGSDGQWYSMIFQVPKSNYVIELVSQMQPSANSALPEMEQRMSDDHCTKFSSYTDTAAKNLEISSINRAASDMATIDDVHTNLYKSSTSLSIDGEVTRRCYHYTTQLDEDVCFTGRTSDAAQDAIFSVADHEAMLWAVHAGTLGSNPSSTKDKYTDSHYALPISSAGLTALKEHFTSNNPYPITKDTRLAYACEQSYIIDPTGFCVQPIGRASWPNCGWDEAVV
jgi:hypothetical protein